MINKTYAKTYCCEDISLIENYQEAVNDETQMWHCHHRLECVDGVYRSEIELKEKGLYYGRPACELIFLTASEHKKIHHNDPSWKKKHREALLGKPSGMLGKNHSKKTREKISRALKGKKRAPFSEEHRKHLSEAHKDKRPWLGKLHTEEAKIKMSNTRRGSIFWNNGIINTRSKECPGPNFIRGRIKANKEAT